MARGTGRVLPLSSVVVALLTLLCALTFAQDRRLQPVVQGRLVVGVPHTYEVQADPGDLIHATVTVEHEGEGAVTVALLNAAGSKVKEEPIYGDVTGPVSLGFVVPGTGRYRLSITAATAGASYSLRTALRTPKEQVANAPSTGPEMVGKSPLVAQLAEEVSAGRRDAIDRFWAGVKQRGAPLVEPVEGNTGELLATFLWRQTYDIHNVLVLWPGRFGDDHYMSHLAGTDVWYRTVRIVRGSRFAYSLAPNDGGRAPHYSAQVDPLNERSSAVINVSVLETAGAPDESWFRRTPSSRGIVTPHRFESALLKGRRDISCYTPPGYVRSDGPYALLILFDGASYARQPAAREADADDLMRLGAPTTLDNLINDRRIRPTVACFVDYRPDGTRNGDLQNPIYAAAIATELVPWIRSSYAVSTEPRNVMIGGYSAGGGAAGFVALRYPTVFGGVLLQSGGGPRLTPLYLEAPRVPVRFYYDQGLYEFAGAGPRAQTIRAGELPFREVTAPDIATSRRLRDVLEAKGYEVTYRETGGAHEQVHWRATLAEGLMVLLGTGLN